MFTREQVQSMIDERKRMKQNSEAKEVEKTLEQAMGDLTDSKMERHKKEILQALIDATPKKGKHYFDGDKGADSTVPGPEGPPGMNGRDADEEAVVRRVLAQIPIPENGKDGVSVDPEEVYLAIKEATKKLKAKDVGSMSLKEIQSFIKIEITNVKNNFESRISNLRDTVMRNYGGHGGSGGGVTPLAYNIGPFLDGATSIFTIPANSAIIQISSSSAPFQFDPAVDYTGSGTTTLTFTAAVDPAVFLLGGQTINVLYVPS